jgi:hypothetical protein
MQDSTRTSRLRDPIFIARLSLILFALGVLALHLLPSPILVSTSNRLIPYDFRLNFLSEYVRTQYGWLMTLNFCLLGVAALSGAYATHARQLKTETKLLFVAGAFLFLLALFRCDLVELTRDGPQCDNPARIEPCTWMGNVHNPLSSVVFLSLGLVWLKLALRKPREMLRNKVIMQGLFCLACVVIFTHLSSVYVSHIQVSERHWFGLGQRSIVLPAITWFWFLLNYLSQKTTMPDPTAQ